jgi:hypothetical protein
LVEHGKNDFANKVAVQVANGLLGKHLAVLPLASTVRTKKLRLRLFTLFLSYVE